MVLPVHILIACSSIIYTAFLYLHPSKFKLQIAYLLVALTLITGTFLVVSMHAHLVQACTTGLIYLMAVSIGIASARRKLAKILNHTS